MKDIKLNLGSGNHTRLDGYLNVDFRDMPNIDVKHDLNNPLPYKDGTVSNIFASHVLEHFWWQDSVKILKDWFRVLKPEGKLEIWTVDFDNVVYRLMTANNYEDMMKDVNWRLYSKREPEGNAHHSIFNRRYLFTLLKDVGFKDIGLIDPNKFEFRPLHDGINLGMIAVK